MPKRNVARAGAGLVSANERTCGVWTAHRYLDAQRGELNAWLVKNESDWPVAENLLKADARLIAAAPEMHTVMVALMSTIDATGGLVRRGGFWVPAGDEDWIDLGDVAVAACNALKKSKS
jgi:hypothetical protein